jgi:hypothetical protein
MAILEMVSTRRVLFCAVAVALCLSFAPVSAQQAITTPILTTAQNFRDLAGISTNNGGTGFINTTSNDGVMRTGVFYRSNVLALSNADWITISTLHIGRDIDLRTPSEILSPPDVVPNGAIYTNVNIYGTPGPPPAPPITDPPRQRSTI